MTFSEFRVMCCRVSRFVCPCAGAYTHIHAYYICAYVHPHANYIHKYIHTQIQRLACSHEGMHANVCVRKYTGRDDPDASTIRDATGQPILLS
jgi:hypothetical protein